MAKYEYVNKDEYRPVREELENIIKKTQRILKKKAGITFQFELIGSGSKHLITRVKGGNKGFDFDYNIIINNDDDGVWKADYARKEFTKALDEAIKGTKYSHPENQSVAITIKVKDTKNSKILHSCDFAVVYYPGDVNDGHMCSKMNLETNKCIWNMRKYTKDYLDKLDWLKDNVSKYWDKVKIEYLKLKNANNDPEKHSFQLFYEAINNLIDQYY